MKKKSIYIKFALTQVKLVRCLTQSKNGVIAFKNSKRLVQPIVYFLKGQKMIQYRNSDQTTNYMETSSVCLFV